MACRTDTELTEHYRKCKFPAILLPHNVTCVHASCALVCMCVIQFTPADSMHSVWLCCDLSCCYCKHKGAYLERIGALGKLSKILSNISCDCDTKVELTKNLGTDNNLIAVACIIICCHVMMVHGSVLMTALLGPSLLKLRTGLGAVPLGPSLHGTHIWQQHCLMLLLCCFAPLGVTVGDDLMLYRTPRASRLSRSKHKHTSHIGCMAQSQVCWACTVDFDSTCSKMLKLVCLLLPASAVAS